MPARTKKLIPSSPSKSQATAWELEVGDEKIIVGPHAIPYAQSIPPVPYNPDKFFKEARALAVKGVFQEQASEQDA